MNKKTLLLDVDEVICFSGYLEAVNAFLGSNYKIDDFTDYYIDDVAISKDKKEKFNEFMKSWNLYKNPVMLPNSKDSIKELSKYYDIYICSSCLNPFNIKGSGKQFVDKFNFLIKEFPFLSAENFIFTNAKNIIKADIIIDDRLDNLNNDIETKILFPSYHNKEYSNEYLNSIGVIRAGYDWRNGWLEVNNILLGMLDKKKREIKTLKLDR